MKHWNVIQELSNNGAVFQELLGEWPEGAYLWKPASEKWCALEIVCHLFDEEREDFRARTRSVLEDPLQQLTPLDPVRWVLERNYMQQDFDETLAAFLEARKQSIHWLESLSNPKWNNTYQHPKLGPMTASLFLANWLAHDYLHLRQLLNLKFAYLKEISGEDLSYAGNW